MALAPLGKAFGDEKASGKVAPFKSPDSFFGMPELQEHVVATKKATKCAAGMLALRVPDPPAYAPPAICAISKDGKIAAVGGKDVELHLWSTETGQLLSTLKGHETAWTGSNDNTFFITMQEDSKVYLWDQEALRQRCLLGHPDEPLTCCSVSLDDMYVVCGGARGTIYTWDSDNGSEYRQYDDGHEGPVATVMCYPMQDGKHVIISCGAADHTIVVWDLETSSKRTSVVVDELEHAKNTRYHISKDGTQVLCWCTDSVPFPNLVFVDALSGSKMSVFCHGGLVRHAVFAKDSAKIISCGSDGTIVMWDTATLEPLITLTGHVGSVLSCGINEEGSRIVSSGEDCTVRVWSTEDGQQLMQLAAQDEPIKFCQFAKSAGSPRIITCDMSGRVYVWSILSEVMASLIRRFADTLSCVSLSHDSKLLVAGCSNGRVMLWDAELRENIWEYSHHAGRVEAVAFNSFRDLVASCGADGRVALISVDTGKQANAYTGVDEPILSLVFSPDDEKLAGVSADGKLLIYAVNATSREPRLILQNNMARVLSCVWSPNSKLIAGCGSDGAIMVWNATTGVVFTVLEGQAAATCCCFDVMGKLLAVGNVLGRTSLYNLETAEMVGELRSNAATVVDVVFNNEGSRLTTICSRQAIIWDIVSGERIRTFDFVVDKTGDFQTPPHPTRTTVAHSGTVLFDHESEALVYDMVPVDDPLLKSYYLSDTRMIGTGSIGHKRAMVWSAVGSSAAPADKFHTTHDAITSCHFSKDDRLCVMGTQDGNVVVYDVLHGETVEVIAAHQNGPCRCVRLNWDNTKILSCGADAKVILWDWKARAAEHIYSGHFISIGACDIAYQDNRVVSGDNHGMISVWEKDTGAVVQTLPLAHSRAVLAVSMSADGSTVASVGADDKVSIWAVDVGVELVSLSAAIESHPLFCAFSADGAKLAVTESNGSVMVWNAVVGCQWFQIPAAHKGKVTACAWSYDCRRFVTAGTDSVVAVWDAESGAPVSKFNVSSGSLNTVAVSPNGQYLAAGSSTGTLSVINLPAASRVIPEPSFLNEWLGSHEAKQTTPLYTRLLSQFPFLPNVQDAQGWSLVAHVLAGGNAQVAHLVLGNMPDNCGTLGLCSSVPFALHTRVQLRQEGDGEEESGDLDRQKSLSGNAAGGGAGGFATMAQRIQSVSPNNAGALTGVPMAAKNPAGAQASARSFIGKSMHHQSSVNQPGRGSLEEDLSGNEATGMPQRSTKSFSAQVKRVAVELFTEKRQLDHLELMGNNALALALNSRSSEAVQVVLDAVAASKVSAGSYHAITDMMPSLAVRYPYMCYGFLAALELATLGDLEVPVAVMKGLDNAVIRTAPIFTNVRNLWHSHLKLHEVRHGPQPYAHVKASMVRLPFACSLGRESLLRTMVESDVPVQAYSTPTLRAVIRHKWRLYARSKLIFRALLYFFYCLVFTVYCILYAMEDHSLSLADYWKSSTRAKVHLIADGYLAIQASWYAWTELSQVFAIGFMFYFRSHWNVLDVVSITLMLVIIPFHLARFQTGPGDALAPMLAFEIVMTWFKVFFYALAFEPTGPVVHMVFQIAYAVKAWAVLLFMNLVAFGCALMVLFQYTPSDDQFLDFGKTLLTLWTALFGVFDISSTLHDGEWRQLAIIFFSGFLFLTNIVLLNMLIALMRDIYQKVRDTEQDVFLKGRAQLIVEVETLMPTAQAERFSLMPPYVHMLTQVRREVHSADSMTGRLDRLEASLAVVMEQLSTLSRNGTLGQPGGNKPAGHEMVRHASGMEGVVGPMGHMMGPGMAMDQLAAMQMANQSSASNMTLGSPQLSPQGQGHGQQGGMHMDPAFAGMMGMMGGMGMGMGGMGMGHMAAMLAAGMGMDPSAAGGDQGNLIALVAQRLRESESQMPALLRQVDRLQRTANNQEMRLEGVVIVLRDIEALLRNQQPVIIHQETRPAQRRAGTALTEAELEQEVKRLLGKNETKL